MVTEGYDDDQGINAWVKEIEALLQKIRTYVGEQKKFEQQGTFDIAVFFKEIREQKLFSRLSQSQVEGMETKLEIFRDERWPISWAAYGLATSYHETAQKMVPVREGLGVSDAWREKNLRYYPWYGRGDVQLTWERNYKKAGEEIGVDLIDNPDLALDNSISAKILVKGMEEGWFAEDIKGPHNLERHLPTKIASIDQFKQARRIINGTDKAVLVAFNARGFQEALIKANYGGNN